MENEKHQWECTVGKEFVDKGDKQWWEITNHQRKEKSKYRHKKIVSRTHKSIGTSCEKKAGALVPKDQYWRRISINKRCNWIWRENLEPKKYHRRKRGLLLTGKDHHYLILEGYFSALRGTTTVPMIITDGDRRSTYLHINHGVSPSWGDPLPMIISNGDLRSIYLHINHGVSPPWGDEPSRTLTLTTPTVMSLFCRCCNGRLP